MTIENCKVCGGTHFGDFECPLQQAAAVKQQSEPSPQNFAQRLRGSAAFLASNYSDMSEEEARVICRALESAADHVEAFFGAYAPKTKRQFFDAAVKELNLDTSDPFTLIFANACALLEQRDHLNAAVIAALDGALKDEEEILRLRAALEADQRDAARLDYLERRWMDGVHLEVCHKGGGDHPLGNAVMAVTLYVGSREYVSSNVRSAIDDAMQNDRFLLVHPDENIEARDALKGGK